MKDLWSDEVNANNEIALDFEQQLKLLIDANFVYYNQNAS